MKTSSAKAKGRRLQQWVMEQIADMLNMECGPDKLIASREMGQSGTDVRLIDKALKMFPFSVECKNQEKWSVHKWIEQAKSNQEEGTDWIIFASRNRQKPVIIMDADRFLDLYDYALSLTAEDDLEEGFYF